MNQVVQVDDLMGLGWDSGKRYISEIMIPLLNTTLLWTDLQMEANQKYHRTAASLPQVDCLDQEALERDLAAWEAKLDREYAKNKLNRIRIERYRKH